MSEPFLAEVKIVGFNFCPSGLGLFVTVRSCLLPKIKALFSLLGTIYGGDGETSFALPDLRGRVPVHMGQGLALGQRAGEENHALLEAEIPNHIHTARGSSEDGDATAPLGRVLAGSPQPDLQRSRQSDFPYPRDHFHNWRKSGT